MFTLPILDAGEFDSCKFLCCVLIYGFCVVFNVGLPLV